MLSFEKMQAADWDPQKGAPAFCVFRLERRAESCTASCAQAAGLNPYPHKFHVSLSLPEYVKKFSTLEAAEQLKDSTVSVAGAPGLGFRNEGWHRVGGKCTDGAAECSPLIPDCTAVPRPLRRSSRASMSTCVLRAWNLDSRAYAGRRAVVVVGEVCGLMGLNHKHDARNSSRVQPAPPSAHRSLPLTFESHSTRTLSSVAPVPEVQGRTPPPAFTLRGNADGRTHFSRTSFPPSINARRSWDKAI